jgi:hypothetical protein
MERRMTPPPDVLARAEAAEAALDHAAELLAQLGDELAQMRKYAAIARTHLAAIERGEPDPPPAEWEPIQ